MTEQEYIDATNLAKVRAAKSILRDVLPTGPLEGIWLGWAMRYLAKLERRLAEAAAASPATKD